MCIQLWPAENFKVYSVVPKRNSETLPLEDKEEIHKSLVAALI